MQFFIFLWNCRITCKTQMSPNRDLEDLCLQKSWIYINKMTKKMKIYFLRLNYPSCCTLRNKDGVNFSSLSLQQSDISLKAVEVCHKSVVVWQSNYFLRGLIMKFLTASTLSQFHEIMQITLESNLQKLHNSSCLIFQIGWKNKVPIH